jgi:hypothetical protein
MVGRSAAGEGRHDAIEAHLDRRTITGKGPPETGLGEIVRLTSPDEESVQPRTSYGHHALIGPARFVAGFS